MPLLTLIGENELDLTPSPPEFEALAALHLGELPGAEISIDALLLEIGETLTDHPAFITSLQLDENELAEVGEPVSEAEVNETAAVLADAQAEGDVIVAGFEDDLGVVTPPPPPTGGVGPGGGGGGGVGPGGGGGGGTGVVEICGVAADTGEEICIPVPAGAGIFF
jgi:hypothetical protein